MIRSRSYQYPLLQRVFSLLVVLLCFSGAAIHASSAVEQIISLKGMPSFTQRHHALHKLTASQLGTGAGQFIDFMRAQRVPENMRPVDYMSLVNDSFNLMVKHDIRAEELLKLIVSVIPNASADEVWRDYAVQKLGYTLDRIDISKESLEAGFVMLERAMKGDFSRVQGTALIVALKLSDACGDAYPFLKKSALGQSALICAQNSDAVLIDRVTALQVAGLCDSPGALDYSRSILLRKNTKTAESMLFISAIAVLGERGTSEDLILLNKHRLSPDIRIRSATTSAISKIRAAN